MGTGDRPGEEDENSIIPLASAALLSRTRLPISETGFIKYAPRAEHRGRITKRDKWRN